MTDATGSAGKSFQSRPDRDADPRRHRRLRPGAADGGGGGGRPELDVQRLPAGGHRHAGALREDRLPLAAEPARAGGELGAAARGDRGHAGLRARPAAGRRPGELLAKRSRALPGRLALSLANATNSLDVLAQQIQSSSIEVASAANSVNEIASELASGSSEQAASVVEITAAMEELARTASQIAENAAVAGRPRAGGRGERQHRPGGGRGGGRRGRGGARSGSAASPAAPRSSAPARRRSTGCST